MKNLFLTVLLASCTLAQGHSYGGNLADATPQKPVPISSLPPEFGSEIELKDVLRVYVASDDLEARKLIVKELEKESRLAVVGRIEDCQIALVYAGTASNNGATLSPFGVVSARVLQVGEIAAIARGPIDEDGKRVLRILWSSRKSQQWSSGIPLGRHPAVNGARDFVKAWRKVNPKS